MFASWTGKEKVQTFAGILTGFGTLASVVVVYCMTHDQNEISQKALDATNHTMTMTERNYVIENRAWVGFDEPPRLSSGNLLSRGCSCVVRVKNFGKTPAESISIGYRVSLKGTTTGHARLQYLQPFILSPSQREWRWMPIPDFSDLVYAKLSGGTAVLYLRGIITYRDIYSRSDTTDFSFTYRQGAETLVPSGTNRMR
jgi:hypothetical protein